MLSGSNSEKKAIYFGASFTVVIHIVLLIILIPSEDAKAHVKRAEFVEARILKKGDIGGGKKQAKFLPDKMSNSAPEKEKKGVAKVEEVKKVEPQKEVKAVVKNEKTDEISLNKKLDDISKKLNETKKEDKNSANLKDFSNIANKVTQKLDQRSDQVAKKGESISNGTGGHPDGDPDGDEVDPSKTVQGSLYGRRVGNDLRAAWKMPPIDNSEDKNLVVVIQLYINSDGSISKYETKKLSPNSLFNNSVKSLLDKIKKVQAPPADYADFYSKNGLEVVFIPKK
ncbi:TonB C-terminal domain-containing protein [bacterium]|nr:TonB C-terminal domain-containing protein [bacterium]